MKFDNQSNYTKHVTILRLFYISNQINERTIYKLPMHLIGSSHKKVHLYTIWKVHTYCLCLAHLFPLELKSFHGCSTIVEDDASPPVPQLPNKVSFVHTMKFVKALRYMCKHNYRKCLNVEQMVFMYQIYHFCHLHYQISLFSPLFRIQLDANSLKCTWHGRKCSMVLHLPLVLVYRHSYGLLHCCKNKHITC